MMAPTRVLAIVVLTVAFALPAIAAQGRTEEWLQGRLFPPDVVLKHQARLKLTDAQRQAIRKELVAVQSKVAEIDFDLMDAAVALQTALDAGTLDRVEVLQRADAVLAADARKKRAWLELLLAVRAILTPEQVQILKRAEPGPTPP